MKNSPSHDPQKSSDTLMCLLNPLADIAEYIGQALYRLFQTRIPQNLQDKGLTRKIFDEIYKKFYEISRGHLFVALRNTIRDEQEEGAMLAKQVLLLGKEATHKRAMQVLQSLVEEYGFDDNPDIQEFLESTLCRSCMDWV